MNTQKLIEESARANVKKKHVLELEITKQFEQLRALDISMEKNSDDDGRGKRIGTCLKDYEK